MEKGNPSVWCADLLVPVDPCAKGSACTGEGDRYPQQNESWESGAGTVKLAGAGNEVLAFQLVVEKAAGRLEALRLEGAEDVALEVSENVAVPLGERFVDDALVPVDPAAFGESALAVSRKAPRVKGRRRQTFTIELAIPQGAPAGRREAALVLKAGGEERRLKLALAVHGFDLPDANAGTADINSYSRVPVPGGLDADTSSEAYLRAQNAYFRMARQHRALLHVLPYGQSGRLGVGYAPTLTGLGARRRISDWTSFDRQWGSLIDGRAFAGCRGGTRPIEYLYLPVNLLWPARFEVYGKPGFDVEYQGVIRQMAQRFAEKGWTRTKFEVFFNHKARWKFFPWDMDEIYYERDNDATIRFGRMATEAARDYPAVKVVNRIDSSWIFDRSARTEMADVINLWVVNRSSHSQNPDEVAHLRGKGQEVWFYGGAGVLEAPNRLDNLKWPWIAWGRETDGFTWWNGFGWGSWEQPGRGGDFCFYPGDRFGIEGPLASLRLKVLHRGMQDWALLDVLGRKTGSRAAADAAIRETIGCGDREDWYQRGEKAEGSGAEIQTTSRTERPWNTAPWPAWNAARAAVAGAITRG